jgi:uncharacterized cupin superfamily protein
MQIVMVEELETIVAPGDIIDFMAGVGAGIAIGMLLCGGA